MLLILLLLLFLFVAAVAAAGAVATILNNIDIIIIIHEIIGQTGAFGTSGQDIRENLYKWHVAENVGHIDVFGFRTQDML